MNNASPAVGAVQGPINNKNVLVVGASRGIGLALCKLLRTLGCSVWGTTRGPCPALEEVGVNVVEGVELTSSDQMVLARAMSGVHIDALIINAGVAGFGGLIGDVDMHSLENQMQINAYGPLRIANAIAPQLSAGAKILIISTMAASIAQNTNNMGLSLYRISKAACNMMGRCLANELKERGIAVRLVHPGVVDSDMTRGLNMPSMMGDMWTQISVTPDVSARGIISNCLETLSIETTGDFRDAHDGAEILW